MKTGTLAILVWLVTLGVYLKTNSPTLLSNGDSAELTTSAHTLGVPHAPGYPLFALTGKIFSVLISGKPAYRINVATNFFGSLAVLNVFFLLFLLTGRKFLSAIGAWILAFSYHFWLFSHIPEVAALNAFFISLLMLLLVLFDRSLLSGGNHFSWLSIFVFVLGLSFSHHHMSFLLLPGIFVYLFLIRKTKPFDLTFKQMAQLGFFFILGMTPYIYVPLRAHAMPFMNFGNVNSLSRFIFHITRAAYGTGALDPKYSEFSLRFMATIMEVYGESLVRSFSWVGILMGLLGLYSLFKREFKIFVLLSLGFLLTGPLFFICARMPVTSVVLKVVLERFLIPSFLIYSVAIGIGVVFMVEILNSFFRKFSPSYSKIIVGGLLLLLPSTFLLRNLPHLDFSKFRLCDVYGRDMLKSIQKGSLVFVNSDNWCFTLWYLQQAEGLRKDLKISSLAMNEPYLDTLKTHFPKLVFPSKIKWNGLVRDLIRLNFSKMDIYLVGVPNFLFANYGLQGNPFFPEPRGLALKVLERKELLYDDKPLWGSFGYDETAKTQWDSNYFVQEIRHLYGLARYNRAVISRIPSSPKP